MMIARRILGSDYEAHDQQRGLTLIEIVITLAVLAIVAAFVGRPLISLIESRTNVNEMSDQPADVQYSLTRIGDEIRFRSDTFQCSASEVTFTQDGSVDTYQLIGDELVANDDSNVIAKDIQDFQCTEIGSDTGLYRLDIDSNNRTASVRAFRRAKQ
ncbi:hypothetical protein A6K26_009185 [Gammaproteobacteria bacterium 2W06]|nr:hypothetical protein A6K26_009185 [Gammaproteobacteria bacterium 2W06]